MRTTVESLNVNNSSEQTGSIHQTDYEAIKEALTLAVQLSSKVDDLFGRELFRETFGEEIIYVTNESFKVLNKLQAIMGYAVAQQIKERMAI